MRNSPNGGLSQRLGNPKKVLLIGERFLLLDALRLALGTEKLEVAAVGTNRQGIDEALNAFNPGIVVLEAMEQPAERLVRSIHWLKESDRIVVGITGEAVSVEAARMVSAGADCVLGLDTGFDNLVSSMKRSLAGKVAMPLDRRYTLERLLREHRAAEAARWLPFHELSARERDIFALVYEGLSADQIAEDACVSVSTVRTHVRNILSKLNVHSQLAAVAMARSNEWFTVDSLAESG